MWDVKHILIRNLSFINRNDLTFWTARHLLCGILPTTTLTLKLYKIIAANLTEKSVKQTNKTKLTHLPKFDILYTLHEHLTILNNKLGLNQNLFLSYRDTLAHKAVGTILCTEMLMLVPKLLRTCVVFILLHYTISIKTLNSNSWYHSVQRGIMKYNL